MALSPRPQSRSILIAAIRDAVRSDTPFAMGRNQDCRHWMGYALNREAGHTERQLRAMETALKFHCLTQNGIYPPTPEFILRFNREYVDCLRQLDYYGLKSSGSEAAVLRAYHVPAQLVNWKSLHPDRSVPSDLENCYLPSLESKRILLISPFANLLAERANLKTFESVWSKIGKTWFHPAEIIPLEIPFAVTQSTQDRYPTVLDLFDAIMHQVATKQFDVALIGASGLGIPIASRIKALGKMGLSIGGDLQVLFGVSGRRWRERTKWQTLYFNKAWIDVPARYVIPEKDEVVEGGSYW